MAEYKAFSEDVEVLGDAVLSILGGMELAKGRALRILAQNGIPSVEAGQWYPQQRVLDAFKTIFEKIGPNTVRTIGRKIPETAQLPPQINSIDAALGSIGTAYQMNHSGNARKNAYRFEKTGPRAATLTCENPYPCEMDLGLIEGMADRFRPSDSVRLTVAHAAGPCRTNGAEICSYTVRW